MKPAPARQPSGRRAGFLQAFPWSKGSYQWDGGSTSWLKIKNPNYSQTEGRNANGRCVIDGTAAAPLRPAQSPTAARWKVQGLVLHYQTHIPDVLPATGRPGWWTG